VLVADHLPELGAHLITALARLSMHNLAKKQSGSGEHAGEKRREEWRNLNEEVLPLQSLEL
jgi:hypothetical protein